MWCSAQSCFARTWDCLASLSRRLESEAALCCRHALACAPLPVRCFEILRVARASAVENLAMPVPCGCHAPHCRGITLPRLAMPLLCIVKHHYALALRLEATPYVALPVLYQAMDSLQRPHFAMQHILCQRKEQHVPAMQSLRFARPGCGQSSLRQSGHSRGSHCPCLASNITALLCRCDAQPRTAKPCLCLRLRWDASHCPCSVLPCIGLLSVRCPCICLLHRVLPVHRNFNASQGRCLTPH